MRKWRKYKLNNNDEYYAYLHRDEVVSNAMKYVAMFTIACAVFIDFLNIGQIFTLIFDTPSSVIANPMSNLFVFIMPYAASAVATLVVAFLSIYVGICFRRIQTSPNNKMYIVLTVLLGCFLLLLVGAITFLRFTSEIKQSVGSFDTMSYDPISLSLFYTAIMLAGMIVSLIYGFFSRDIDREEFSKSEEQEFKHDKAKYDTKTKELVTKVLKDSKYDKREKDFNNKAQAVFKKIEDIVSQIYSIEDPAEIKAVTDAFDKALLK